MTNVTTNSTHEKSRKMQPIRTALKFLNFHLSEEGREIYKKVIQMEKAYIITKEERKEILGIAKEYIASKSLANVPEGTRHVLSSIAVGQMFSWVIGPYVAKHIHVDPDSYFSLLKGFMLGCGSDKIFWSPFGAPTGGIQTDTINTHISRQLVSRVGISLGIGLAALTVELALDFARSFTEYWSQKKYGITPDGVACAYGQDRPIWARFSTIEVYQKVAGYMLFPGSLGTDKQIATSIQGALGSIWRIFPQTFVIVPLIGTKIDQALEKLAKLTHISQKAAKIETKHGKERDEAKVQLDASISYFVEQTTSVPLDAKQAERNYDEWFVK